MPEVIAIYQGMIDKSLKRPISVNTENQKFVQCVSPRYLDANQKLIIAIDGLNCIDLNRNSQPCGTNLFYLPRYLPDGVYKTPV